MNSPWTNSRVEKLRAMWDEGHSASIIAARLSHDCGHAFTRNAIIGKISRLGLCGRPKLRHRRARVAPPKPQGPRVSLPGGKQVEQKPTNPGNFNRWAGARMEQNTAGHVAALPPDDVWSPLPGTKPIRQAALGHTSCRWPIEDGKKRLGLDRLSCGADAPIGEPYCATHAYQAMAPHRRAS